MLKRWCSIKEIEVYLLCEILISKDTLQGQKTVVSLLNCMKHSDAQAINQKNCRVIELTE